MGRHRSETEAWSSAKSSDSESDKKRSRMAGTKALQVKAAMEGVAYADIGRISELTQPSNDRPLSES